MNKTRRDFIFGAVATTAIAPFAGVASDKVEQLIADGVFEDIRVDRYYEIQGGQYGDTGGYGQPGYSMGPELIANMEYWEHCRELEDKLDAIEREGYYLTPSSYFGEPHRRYNKMLLTKKWMMEFYNRHKGETWEMWKSDYDNYIAGLKSRGWRTVNGRFMNPDLGY